MIEIAVSVLVVAIVVLIVRRYRNIFCLPSYWAAYFLCQYLGFLQIRARHGGVSYLFAAIAFGMFYAGLLAADFHLIWRSSAKDKTEDLQSERTHQASKLKPDRSSHGTRIKLLFPVLPLNIGLFVALLAATFVSFVFFAQNGVPILSSFPALAWVQSTSGIVNRLMTVFGPGCYASLGLIAWAVHRESKSRAAWAMMYVGLGLAIISQALLATKAAAILIFIWFNIMLFYLNKRRELRKSLLPLLIVVIPVSAGIVATRLISIQGYWQAGSIVETYYDRITTESAEPADFIFKYMKRFGPLHGGALHREVERIRDQLTGRPKTPILSEYVYNLVNRQSTYTTGLSAGLMLYGAAYAEWGFAGLLLYSFLQGLGFGWIHRRLMQEVSMNLIMLVFWGAIVTYAIGVSGTGTILVGLEYVFLNAIPPLVLLLPFSFFFLLPVAGKSARSGGEGFSGAPQA